MPSNSSGQPKLERAIYAPGSGGMNVNPSWQDDEYVDPMKAARWEIFRHEFRGDPQRCRAEFNLKFGYRD